MLGGDAAIRVAVLSFKWLSFKQEKDCYSLTLAGDFDRINGMYRIGVARGAERFER